MLLADGLDDAFIGVAGERAVYDVDRVLEILVARDGMTYDEAREFYEFNIESAYVGPETPIYVERMSIDDIAAEDD